MNFIEKILAAGFIEQGQKKLVEILPHKAKFIPKWWENYPHGQHWFGVSMDRPDAWFRKDGFDGELQLSLQGLQTGHPVKEQDILLMDKRACRYICIKVGKDNVYETFSGVLPGADVIDNFIKASY